LPPQTYTLLKSLYDHSLPFPEEYLTLSTVVSFGTNLEDFIEAYQVNRHWIQDQGVIFQNIAHFKSAQEVSLEYLEELLNALCTKAIKSAFAR